MKDIKMALNLLLGRRKKKLGANGIGRFEKNSATVKSNILIAMSIFIASITCSTAPKASDPIYSDEYYKCMDNSMGVTFEMIECMNEENSRWDLKLNSSYRILMQSLPEDKKKSLRDAERRWISYRDKHCQSVANEAGGGSASRIEGDSCFLELTAKRAIELMSLLPK